MSRQFVIDPADPLGLGGESKLAVSAAEAVGTVQLPEVQQTMQAGRDELATTLAAAVDLSASASASASARVPFWPRPGDDEPKFPWVPEPKPEPKWPEDPPPGWPDDKPWPPEFPHPRDLVPELVADSGVAQVPSASAHPAFRVDMPDQIRRSVLRDAGLFGRKRLVREAAKDMRRDLAETLRSDQRAAARAVRLRPDSGALQRELLRDAADRHRDTAMAAAKGVEIKFTHKP